jgi:ABC-type nitrate/sulfonate/bicarbonate transport system permease component
VIAGNQGLGYLISLEAGMFRASGVLAAVAVLMICSVLITELLTKTEVSAIRWRI